VKLPAFNIFGQALQSLSGLTATNFTLGGAGAAPKAVPGSYSGPTSPLLVVQRYIFAGTVTFPAGLAGSYGIGQTAATNSTSYSIQRNGTPVGTMNFAAAATVATFTMASATAFSAGDLLTVVAPASPDPSLAGLAWTLVGK
jgi:hypothetical protein